MPDALATRRGARQVPRSSRSVTRLSRIRDRVVTLLVTRLV